jgi:hypothetical protein
MLGGTGLDTQMIGDNVSRQICELVPLMLQEHEKSSTLLEVLLYAIKS